MAIEKIRDVAANQVLYRDTETGIAWVADGSSGTRHTVHPSIDQSGSVRGMKDLGRWGRSDRTVACDGYIYNISVSFTSSDLDRLVAAECQCGGTH